MPAFLPAPGIHPGNAGPHPMLKHSKRRRDRVRTALLATVLLPAMLVRGDGQRADPRGRRPGDRRAARYRHRSLGHSAHLRRQRERCLLWTRLRRRNVAAVAARHHPPSHARPPGRGFWPDLRSFRPGRPALPLSWPARGGVEEARPAGRGYRPRLRCRRQCADQGSAGRSLGFCRRSSLPSTCSPISGGRRTWCGHVWCSVRTFGRKCAGRSLPARTSSSRMRCFSRSNRPGSSPCPRGSIPATSGAPTSASTICSPSRCHLPACRCALKRARRAAISSSARTWMCSKAATPGSSRLRARRPVGRSWRTTRTCRSAFPVRA